MYKITAWSSAFYSPFSALTPAAQESRLARNRGLQQEIGSCQISAKGVILGGQGKATGAQGESKVFVKALRDYLILRRPPHPFAVFRAG